MYINRFLGNRLTSLSENSEISTYKKKILMYGINYNDNCNFLHFSLIFNQYMDNNVNVSYTERF